MVYGITGRVCTCPTVSWEVDIGGKIEVTDYADGWVADEKQGVLKGSWHIVLLGLSSLLVGWLSIL